MQPDPFSVSHAVRARSAIDFAIAAAVGPQREKSQAFIRGCHLLLQHAHPDAAAVALETNEFTRGASAGTGDWGDGPGRDLADAFIASLTERSLFDAIARAGWSIPGDTPGGWFASGLIGDAVGEGQPAIVRRPTFPPSGTRRGKVSALVVLTAELASVEGAEKFITRELGSAVVRGTNREAVTLLTDTSTTTVALGTDPLAAVRNGLAAAGPAESYVVALPAPMVAQLATYAENSGGMGIRGGTFVPGIEIVALDDTTDGLVVPASRYGTRDWGLTVRRSTAAALNMSDSPSAPSELVSLWQVNARALLASRMFEFVAPPDDGVVVLEGATP